jgi:anti-anti-sigma factor
MRTKKAARTMSTSFERSDPAGTCVLSVEGDFDGLAVPRVREALSAALSEGADRLLLDLSRVDFIDSSALGFIVWADSRIGPIGGRLALAGANPDVARILELSGLIGLAPTVVLSPSIEDALDSIRIDAGKGTPLWVESFEFPSDPSHMAAVRNRVAEIVVPLGLTEAAVFDIKVAVGEALTNAVRHGSPRGTSDTVCVDVRAYPERVDIVVSDSGSGFDGVPSRSSDDLAPGGRGVLFMRALMDAVEFLPGSGGGTDVLLAKRRSAEA